MYNKKTVLKTEELGIGYKGDLLIGGLDLTISEGEVTALVGGNGIGKSTLLKTLTGELRPIEGKVFLSGKDLRRFSSKELARELSIVTTSTMLAGGLKVRKWSVWGVIPIQVCSVLCATKIKRWLRRRWREWIFHIRRTAISQNFLTENGRKP